jgi:hypothetical protein
MKKIILSLSLSIGLLGCSSLELEAVSSSAEETQRILAMGLTHEENLIEANKLESSHMISVVSLQLTNARDEKIQDEIDLTQSKEFSNMVSVSDDSSKFISTQVSESIKTGVLETDSDLQSFYLEGNKDLISGNLTHKLVFSISYNSKNKRGYKSANLCDEWGRCDLNKKEITSISTIASNCSNTGCNYQEVMELNLSDPFLRNISEKGLTLRFNSKNKKNKVKLTKAFLLGYLNIAK